MKGSQYVQEIVYQWSLLYRPLLILATLFGILEGGPWVWTGVFLLGVGIVIDTLYTQQTYGEFGFDEDGETNVNPILQNSVMYLMLCIVHRLQCTLEPIRFIVVCRVWN